MSMGLLATKEGMTQICTETGELVPVTVLRAGPCVVTQRKTKTDNGYNAIQVGFGEVNKPERLPKALRGKPYRYLREFRTELAEEFRVGQTLDVTAFQKGDAINVQGVTKGRGCQGVIKRHGKHGGPGAHGSHFHRTTGSIGMRTWPGRVLKNMKMPGHMGTVVRTTRNLTVVDVDPELHLIFVCGAVPGARNQLVRVVSKAGNVDKRFVKKDAQESA